MDLKIFLKSIHLIVSQDRYSFLTNLVKTLGLELVEKHIVTPILNDAENVSSEEDNNSICSDTDQRFSLDIPYDVYRKMKPVTMEDGSGYKKRKYSMLKQGVWSNLIYDYFFSTYGFPRCYSFKKWTIYDSFSARYFLTFDAVCKDKACKSNLRGVAEKKHWKVNLLKL